MLHHESQVSTLGTRLSLPFNTLNTLKLSPHESLLNTVALFFHWSKLLSRAAEMTLPHSTVLTPVFMPVGTQGTLKGLLPEQMVDLDCRIMLSNTYHLGNR